MTREFIDGDRVGHTAVGAIDQYDAVRLEGERQVAATDTSDEEVIGIAMNSAADGEEITVVLRGMYTANVSDAAVANDYLTASTTSGQLRTIDTAAGETAQQKGYYLAEELDESGLGVVWFG